MGSGAKTKDSLTADSTYSGILLKVPTAEHLCTLTSCKGRDAADSNYTSRRGKSHASGVRPHLGGSVLNRVIGRPGFH